MKRIRVAILGFNTLESFGLRAIIERSEEFFADIISDFEPIISQSDQADFFIITPAIFIANIDFFLPLKSKVLIIASDCGRYKDAANPYLIRINDDLVDIEQQIIKQLLITTTNRNESGLSNREKEVLKEIASGKLNKEIADSLNISINTVQTHRKNISAKLGIRSVSGLSLYAMMNGII